MHSFRGLLRSCLAHSVHCVPWYSGTGWTVGMEVLRVGCFRTFPFCPLCPMVQWDGMDSWDSGSESGMLYDVPILSIVSHGTVGWEGQLG